ncbi:MAG TPA: thioredoxin family protein [Clostridiales bacterium]|nr:thioredoxin family protein [Clostridiales bacterium]HQP69162.1 thioredoxin family protein [Clostridiales bacterium]
MLTSLIPDEKAPELSSVYPRLTSGALSGARLIDMPEDILIRTEKYTLKLSDLQSELEKMPPEQKSMFGENTFIIADQMATRAILETEARSELAAAGQNVASMSTDSVLQSWIGGKVSGMSVTEEEMKSFFDNNQEMTGGAPYDQIKPQIEGYLVQQKQQEAVRRLVAGLGKRVYIAVNSEWAKKQDEIGRDNNVDRARDSGKPTMANFGSDNCVPCQMMKPVRESVIKRYGDKVNVVYVHADKEQMVSARYGISSIPHIIFFDKEGKEFFANTGVMTEQKIDELFKSIGVLPN